MYDEYTDWSDSFDDMDGSDWESHMGGPDYEESERWEQAMESDDYGSDYGYSSSSYDSDYGDDYYSRDDYTESFINNDENYDYEEQELEEEEVLIRESEITDKTSPQERQIEIIKWLESSEFAKKLKSADGFFILRGYQIKLRDGSVSDILDWLFKEGLKGRKSISDYSTSYTKPGGFYCEKLTFFKNDPINKDEKRTPVNFTRKIRILDRLSKSKFAVKLKKGDGFFVYRGNLVQLRDGTKVEILDWLAGEGIINGKIICGYSIVGNKPGEPYLQKWTFFKRHFPA